MILAIDPSTTRTGWAVFKEGGVLVDFGSRVHKGQLHQRVGQLEQLVYRVTFDHNVFILAMESQFVGKNPRSALYTARAAGAVLCGFNRGLTDCGGSDLGVVNEFAPATVKHTCTGHGHSTKERVAVAVERILEVETENNDEADALAIGLTCVRGME